MVGPMASRQKSGGRNSGLLQKQRGFVMMKISVKLLSIGLLISLIVTDSTFAVEIKLPVTSKHAGRDAYQIGLLKLLLQKAKGEHEITISSTEYTQARIIKELKEGSNKINLYWMGTSAKLEKDLLPIRFPVYRGLLGHRIFIIHRDDQVKFNNVKTLVDLQNYKGIQGIGWTDIEILEHSGLKQEMAKYENIFKMINRGARADYFSRGINEAFVEVDARKDKLPNLAVEKKVLLVYPFAMFFFTNRSNQELAKILEEGFYKASSDGSLNNYFYNHPYIKKTFKQANIKNRIRIEITNPSLSSETIAIPNKYWHGRSKN